LNFDQRIALTIDWFRQNKPWLKPCMAILVLVRLSVGWLYNGKKIRKEPSPGASRLYRKARHPLYCFKE